MRPTTLLLAFLACAAACGPRARSIRVLRDLELDDRAARVVAIGHRSVGGDATRCAVEVRLEWNDEASENVLATLVPTTDTPCNQLAATLDGARVEVCRLAERELELFAATASVSGNVHVVTVNGADERANRLDRQGCAAR